jgi:hypothetical protein
MESLPGAVVPTAYESQTALVLDCSPLLDCLECQPPPPKGRSRQARTNRWGQGPSRRVPAARAGRLRCAAGHWALAAAAAADRDAIGTGTWEVQSLVVYTHAAGRLSLDHDGLLRCYQLGYTCILCIFIFLHLNLGYSNEYLGIPLPPPMSVCMYLAR